MNEFLQLGVYEQILKFWCWCWHTTHDLVTPNARQNYAITMELHARSEFLSTLLTTVSWARSCRKVSIN